VFLAGGTNLLDHMKLGIARPGLLVDVTGLPLNAIEPLPDGGVRIGALVRNSDLAAEPVIWQRYPVLSQALRRVKKDSARARRSSVSMT
jgi:xanthine dehydrogenase YagS FAD-binding subunit